MGRVFCTRFGAFSDQHAQRDQADTDDDHYGWVGGYRARCEIIAQTIDRDLVAVGLSGTGKSPGCGDCQSVKILVEFHDVQFSSPLLGTRPGFGLVFIVPPVTREIFERPGFWGPGLSCH